MHPYYSLKLQDVEPAVNRQPGFRRELVEQITSFIIDSQNFLHGVLKYKFPDPGVFLINSHENSKISSFFQHFGEHDQELLTKVWSSMKADTHRKLNFNMISLKLIEQN